MTDVKVVAPDGTTGTIDERMVPQAKNDGFTVVEPAAIPPVKLTPQEELMHPEAALAITHNKPAAPILPSGIAEEDLVDGQIRAVAPDLKSIGNIAPEHWEQAKKDGFKPVSEVKQAVANEPIVSKYETQFKEKYGKLGIALANLGEGAYGEPSISERGIPTKYLPILHEFKVPESEEPQAIEALQRLEEEHPGTALASAVGGALLPGTVPQAALMAGQLAIAPEAEAAAIGKLGLGATKGVAGVIGRLGVKTAVDTAIFNGPAAASQAILDRDPQGAVENLAIGSIANLGLNAVGGAVGKGLGLLSEEKSSNGMMSWFGRRKAGLVGRGEPANIEADMLRHLGVPQSEIEKLAREGGRSTTDMVNLLDKHLPSDFETMNQFEKGKAIAKLGSAGKDLGDISNVLTDMSQEGPKREIKLPEAADMKMPIEDEEKQFIREYVDDKLEEHLATDKTQYSVTPKVDEEGNHIVGSDFDHEAAIQDAKDIYLKIKSGSMDINKFAEDHNMHLFNVTHPEHVDDPVKFQEWLQSKDGATATEVSKLHYNQYATPIDLGPRPTTIYDLRANADDIIDKLSAFKKESITSEADRAIKKITITLTKVMDENGKISPKDLHELSTTVSKYVPKNSDKDPGGVYRRLDSYIRKIRNESDARISAATGDSKLVTKLKEANEKYSLFKTFREGLPLKTNKAGDVLGPVTVQHGGIAGITRRGGEAAAILGGAVVGGYLSPDGSTPEEKLKYKAAGAAFGAALTAGTFFGAKGFRNWWEELGQYKLDRATYRAALDKKDLASKMILQGAIDREKSLSMIPNVLQLMASKEINRRSQEKKNDGFDTLLTSNNGESRTEQVMKIRSVLTSTETSARQTDIAAGADNNVIAPILLQHMQKIHAALLDALPPEAPIRPFTKRDELKPTEQDINNLHDVVRMVNDPYELFKDLQDGTITPKKVALIQSIFPSTLAAMRNKVALESQNIHLNYQDRLLLSVFMGDKMDPSQNNLGAFQSAYASQAPPPRPQAGRKLSRESKVPDSYMTDSQKAAYGGGR